MQPHSPGSTCISSASLLYLHNLNTCMIRPTNRWSKETQNRSCSGYEEWIFDVQKARRGALLPPRAWQPTVSPSKCCNGCHITTNADESQSEHVTSTCALTQCATAHDDLGTGTKRADQGGKSDNTRTAAEKHIACRCGFGRGICESRRFTESLQ